MRTILYATDYSENSVAALHFSYALSKDLHAELIALHVFELPLILASTVSHTYSRKEVRAFADHRKKLIAYCEEHLKSEPEALTITWKIDEGKPASDRIRENAKELRADLIVVGTKGGSPTRKMLLGSTTSSLIASAPCPVLAVPENADFQGIKKMVYATDFEAVDILTIEKMVDLAKAFEAEVHLVHVLADKTDADEDQMDWFKGQMRHKVGYAKMHFDICYGHNVFETLQTYIEEIDPDILGMLQREGHSLIKSLTHRNLVKHVKKAGHVPLLTYHKNNVGSK